MEESLTALLASVAGGRRYWVRAPQAAARPYVVMRKISAVRGYTFDGEDGLVRYRVQIDVYGDTYTAAIGAARAAIAILSGYQSGAIRGIFVDSEQDLPEDDAGEVTNLFRVPTDIIVWHRQT